MNEAQTNPSFLGDFLVVWSRRLPTLSMESFRWPRLGKSVPRRGLERPHPNLGIWWQGDVRLSEGEHRGGVALVHDVASGDRPGESAKIKTALDNWTTTGLIDPTRMDGRYAVVGWDSASGRLTGIADRFRTYPLYYAVGSDFAVVATNLRLILDCGLVAARVDANAIYHYLNFSYIPSPHCAIDGIRKVSPGHVVELGAGYQSGRRYWNAPYREDLANNPAVHAEQLKQSIVGAVNKYCPSAPDGWGTFLSGGTDSSSIAGILAAAISPRRVKSFSIGFDEPGYDELGYSQIAAQEFGLDAHTFRVSEQNAVDLIPELVAAFDEPFGNSSAIPTYYCAALARDNGINVLIAGDGGDEIFGGNERYRKDKLFGLYYQLPDFVRTLIRGGLRLVDGVDWRPANRIRNFVLRGSLPNPDRFYTDDSFASDHFDALLTREFGATVRRNQSLELLREHYGDAQAFCELHKLMYLDLRMAIAENDLVKVTRAARMAGVSVVFPFLDEELIDFTGRLVCDYKVKGLEKRFLFKRAMRDVLPLAIRKKKKQGFGLPVSVWMRRPGPFRDLMGDVVLSERAASRGYFEKKYIHALVDRHTRGAWDHASEIYLLLMLELWHRAVVDRDGI